MSSIARRRPLSLGWTDGAVRSIPSARARLGLENKRKCRNRRLRTVRESLDDFLARTALDPERTDLRRVYGGRGRLLREEKFVDVLFRDPGLADQEGVVGVAGLEDRLLHLVRAHYGPWRTVSLSCEHAYLATVAIVRWDSGNLRGNRAGLLRLFAVLGGLAHLRRLVVYSPDATVTVAEIGRLCENFSHIQRPVRAGGFYDFSLFSSD